MSDSYTATWKPGFRGAAVVSAEAAYDALEVIRKKNNGELDPQTVVEAAKSTRNKLHKMFEWNDTVAANAHRVERARLVMRSIIVERNDTPGIVSRKYELTRSKQKPRSQVYAATEDILADPEARAELLQRALGELVSMRRRYSMLQELAIVFRTVDEVLETVKV